jgi:Pectate lyase superfamily protein
MGGDAMTIDRRGFLYAGGLGAATAPFVMTAHAASAGAPGVADFGVQPNAASDQTAALQNALTELTRAGQPVVLPAGIYVTGPLTLPKGCTIVGTPGLTTLRAKSAGPLLSGDKLGVLHISGMTFEGATKSGAALLSVADTAVTIAWCRFSGAAASAAKLDNCSGIVQSVEIAGTIGIGISAAQATGLTITACRIAACESAGIAVSGTGEDAAGFTVSQNHISNCATGIAADGIGVISGNVVTAASRFGLRLGRAGGQGQMLAQGNILRGCRIGIGVASSGDDIMASLNFIAGAKDGGIRAFDGERLVGPDLVRQSAESYLNLMVAGNVAR